MQESNWLSLCDFKQPVSVPPIYDSTAGACGACGLLQIADMVDDDEKNLYRTAAENILKAEYENFCDWSDNEESILQKGMESYSCGEYKSIIYGDYYFTEGIYRLMGFDTTDLW